MPQISRFYGIVITMNYDDHNPPHFHAEYGDHHAAYRISPVRMSAGSLPPRADRMVRARVRAHRSELLADWDLARRSKPLNPIAGLE